MTPTAFPAALVAIAGFVMVASLGCGPNTQGPPPVQVTNIVCTYDFSAPGYLPSDIKVTVRGCLVGPNGRCAAAPVDGVDGFMFSKSERVNSCGNPGDACSYRRISVMMDAPNLKQGSWEVTAISDIFPVEIVCPMSLVPKTSNSVAFNIYDASPSLRCTPSQGGAQRVLQSFTIQPGSSITLTHGAMQQIVPVTDGKVNFSNAQAIRDINLSLADTTIAGIDFTGARIDSVRGAYVDLQPPTSAGQFGTIPAGTAKFDLTFRSAGQPVRMTVITGDVWVSTSGNQIRLRSHFDVDSNPNDPLQCAFSPLGGYFPFTADVDLVGTDPPLRHRAAGKP